MPSFSDSFWSEDLTGGLDILFERLRSGCDQCDLFIQLFASRMQFEVGYGRKLYGINDNLEGIDSADESGETTVSNALINIIKSNSDEGKSHLDIASNIEMLVLKPFSKWSNEHRERVTYSEKLLKNNSTNFKKSRIYVSKLEKDYFNKCRKLEDFKKDNFSDDKLAKAMKNLELEENYESQVAREKDYQLFATIASIDFDYQTMRETLKLFLTKLPKSEYKLPLISYSLQNTNSGSEITKFILDELSLKDTDHAELFGQDLINLGFLKYCNGVGKGFVNSKKFQYQWKNYAYTFASLSFPTTDGNVQELEGSGKLISSTPSSESSANNSSQTITEKPDISSEEKQLFNLMRDVKNSDNKYRKESFKMDSLRCSVEELMIDHLTFMEKCEIDRLNAVKKATFDFCSVLGNKVAFLKICVEKMMTNQESIDPVSDLLHIISNHRTGVFKPTVIAYKNYYNPGSFQNFGIDLETRCRLDKKVVPLIVSVILSFMDGIYPDLANDKIRTTIWTAPVKLNLTHELRSLLNKETFENDKKIFEILQDPKYDPSTIASVMKLYLLELPEPIIINEVYEVLKLLYSKYPPSNMTEDFSTNVTVEATQSETAPEDTSKIDSKDSETKRVRGLSTTLMSLPKPHIATLDAISTHFFRLINIVKMGDNGKQLAEEFTHAISKEFANCIIQVKIPDGNDLGYKIFYDLLVYKKQIFTVLKSHSSRPRKKSN